MFIINFFVWIYTLIINIKVRFLTWRLERASNRLINSYSNLTKPYEDFKQEIDKCAKSITRTKK